MGYMAHHAVVVHIPSYVLEGRYESTAPDLDAFRASLPEKWRPLVIGPISTVVNGDYTAVFLPDGSNEGWRDSDDGDEYRARFAALFRDGGCGVAEVRFGGDDSDHAFVRDPREEEA